MTQEPITLHNIVDNAEYVKVQVIDGKFQIRENFVQDWLKKKANVIAIDELTGDKTLLTPFELTMDAVSNNIKKRTYQGGYGTMLTFDWYPMESALPDTETTKWSEALLKRFHWSFYNELKDYLVSNEFRELNNFLNNQERKTKQIFPSKEDVYKVFNIRTDIVKVVFIGYDPYLNNHSSGIAFATNQSSKPVSLKEIEIAIKRELEYPENWKLQNDLDHVVKQGVMFMNSSLTGTQKAGYYTENWKPFTTKVLKTISNFKEPIIFVFLGKVAQEYRYLIDDKHYVLSVEHPASASYRNRNWNSEGIFKKINEILIKLEAPIIKW